MKINFEVLGGDLRTILPVKKHTEYAWKKARAMRKKWKFRASVRILVSVELLVKPWDACLVR